MEVIILGNVFRWDSWR